MFACTDLIYQTEQLANECQLKEKADESLAAIQNGLSEQRQSTIFCFQIAQFFDLIRIDYLLSVRVNDRGNVRTPTFRNICSANSTPWFGRNSELS
jgi:hypothetical protein